MISYLKKDLLLIENECKIFPRGGIIDLIKFITLQAKGVQRIFFRGETEGGPPSTQPQPLGLGLPMARNFLIFNLFKKVFRSLFNAFCSNSSHICLNYRYKFLLYTFSISCLEILGGDGHPFLPPPLHAS